MSLPSAQRVFLESIASADPEGRFVIVDDIQTFYKISVPQQEEKKEELQHVNNNDNTNPDKPVILCLHHILGDLYEWKYIMQPLANATGCHVIAYDRISFGLTERPIQWEKDKNPYTQEALCEFILKFLSCLGYADKKIVFVGASAGGAISSYLSIKYPHITFALIHVCPAIKVEDQGPPPIACMILGSFLGKLVLKYYLSREVPSRLLYYDVKSIPDWETVIRPHYRVQLTLPNFYEAFSFQLKYFTPLEILPHKNVLQKISTLFIVGSDDKYTTCDAHKKVFEEIESNSPSDSILEFKVLTQCAHLPHEEKPQECEVENSLCALEILQCLCPSDALSINSSSNILNKSIVFGNVQGVFFRKYTKDKATELGIVGWDWLSNVGSPYSHIERTDYSERNIEFIGFTEFEIKH
nr:15773_t:CDS:2 [Entrophospora candida]